MLFPGQKEEESHKTASHTVNAKTLAREPNLLFRTYLGLVHLQGMLWWEAPERLHNAGLDTDFGDLPVSLAELLWKRGHFFLLKLGRESINCAMATQCPLPRAARDTAGQSLISWKEENFLGYET